ncbi:MAG: ABC transporter permease [Chloroflexi bacterium]|nr:ABC transporter permease [Chloroflexota bacterium]
MSYADTSPAAIEAGPQPSANYRALRRLLRRPIAVVAIVIIVVIYGAGILAPWVAPYGFNEADFQNRYADPSLEHPLGTDNLGRDLLSRAIWSAQTTVIVSVAAVLTGGLFMGVTAGLAAGYAGGRTDSIIMRAADMFASVPTILLVLIITATLLPRIISVARDVEDLTGFDWIVSSGAPSYFLVFGALAIFGWTGIARVVRSQVLALRQEPYVIAARASGAGTPRILFLHLLPNLTNLLLVAFTLSFGALATAEVGLTFLGIGVQPPHPSFGLMVSEGVGLSNVREHTILIIVPATFIVLLVMSFNLLGDQLTDVLSPRHR